MKIGIMTYYRPINYGAFLQAYALSHRLNQEEDIEAEIIDFHMLAEDIHYESSIKLRRNVFWSLYERKKFRMIREKLPMQILSQDSLCSNEIDDFISFVNQKYDVIIAGSDEIWKVDGYRGFPTPYFLPGELHCKKVSYAASGRTPFKILTEENRNKLKRYYEDFDYIGVRDDKTRNEILNLISNKAVLHINYDPSFVYDFKPNADNGRRLIKEYFKIDINKKVIAVMYNEKIRSSPSLGSFLTCNFGKKYEFISLYNWNVHLKNNGGINPFEWIDIIAAVDGVVSMYFHGICFSMITGTPFFAIEKRASSNEESKIYDLLNRVNMLEYYSLGLNEAISQQKLSNFFQKIENCEITNKQLIVNKAQQEFIQFINMLREICHNEIENA